MIIATINFTGNVGKSTISRHLLAPRMTNSKIVSIESINSDEADDSEAAAIRGREFGDLIEELMISSNVIIDVGASNVEDFIDKMEQHKGSHNVFNCFIIPMVPERKQLKDSIATIVALSEIGVPAKNIKVVFNKVDPSDNLDKVFKPIIDFYNQSKLFTPTLDAVIYESELYDRLTSNVVISELIENNTDFLAAIGETDDVDEKRALARAYSTRMLSETAKENLDEVFKVLF